DAGAMVEHDAAPDAGERIDIDLEDLARPALQVEREIMTAEMPERMGEAIGLDRLEALEIEQRLDRPVAGGIALEGGGEIGTCRGSDFGPRGQRFAKSLADEVGRDVGMVEPLGKAMRQRILEAVIAQDGRDDERGERRFIGEDCPGIGDDRLPDGVDRAQLAGVPYRLLQIAAHRAVIHRRSIVITRYKA